MGSPPGMLGLAAVAALAMAAGAAAQTHVWTCVNSELNATEPLGDRAGHSLQVVRSSCTDSGGPLEGVVSTQSAIWEHDLAASKLLSSDGVGRKPGVLMAYRITEGAMRPVMKDGRPAGWTASGKGVYTIGTGAASALAGRSFSWMARSTGPRRFTMEYRLDD